MAIFSTTNLAPLMPRVIADELIKSAASTSAVATLASQRPMRFGAVDYPVLTGRPKAEFVEEGAQKSPTDVSLGSVTAKPHKAQVTMRFNQEVLIADEDYQLGVISEVAALGADALADALDLGVFHRINPLTGSEIGGWTNYIGATTNTATLDDSDPDAALNTAISALLDGEHADDITGAAFSKKFLRSLATLNIKAGDQPTSQRRYPELGLGVRATSFDGMDIAVNNTVAGRPATADNGTLAIVGDWESGIRWGIQHEFPMEVITTGDPDGQGDLKRQNQIAIRLETIFAWYVFPEKFAVVKAA